jgi:hypothetical protein
VPISAAERWLKNQAALLLLSWLRKLRRIRNAHTGLERDSKGFLDIRDKFVFGACSVLVDEAEDVLEEKVGGERVTFRVYVFLLRVGEASVRDVFHGCGLSSPSLALHHLEKLEELKLARKDQNGIYHCVVRRFGVLHFFHKTGKWLLPRSFFYMIMYATIAVACAFVLPTGMREVAIILSVIGFTLSLVDTVLFLKLIPYRSRSRTVPFNN